MRESVGGYLPLRWHRLAWQQQHFYYKHQNIETLLEPTNSHHLVPAWMLLSHHCRFQTVSLLGWGWAGFDSFLIVSPTRSADLIASSSFLLPPEVLDEMR